MVKFLIPRFEEEVNESGTTDEAVYVDEPATLDNELTILHDEPATPISIFTSFLVILLSKFSKEKSLCYSASLRRKYLDLKYSVAFIHR